MTSSFFGPFCPSLPFNFTYIICCPIDILDLQESLEPHVMYLKGLSHMEKQPTQATIYVFLSFQVFLNHSKS